MTTEHPLIKPIVPHMSCLIYQQLTDVEEGQDPLTIALAQGYAEIFIMTPTGIVKHHKLRGTNRYVRIKVNEVPGIKFSPLTEEVQFLPAGKIPYDLLTQVEAFFRKVIQVKGTAVEAMIWILWNEAQGYHLFVPNQTVSKASARYDWDGVPAGSSIIVDIHSHADFGAFFSGTDNADDVNSVRFSGVIGNNDKPTRSYAWRFNYRDKKFDVKVDDLFVVPEAQQIATPDEWINKVNTHSATTYTPGKWSANSGNAGQSAYQGSDWWKNRPSRADMGQVPATPKGGAGGNSTAKGQESLDFTDQESFLEEFHRRRGEGKKKGNSGKGGTASKKEDGSSAEAGEPFENMSSSTGYFPGWPFGHMGGETREERMDSEIQKIGSMIYVPGDDEEDPVGARASATREVADLEKMSDFVVGVVASAQANPRFDELVCNHGLEVATGFCVINDLMVSVDGVDSLVEELVTDMAQMTDPRRQASIIRTLFSNLPQAEQDRFAVNGM